MDTEFEFSPKISEGVLALVNDLYFDVRPLREGQIRYIAVSREEGSGKPMEALQKVEVILTKEAPWDEELVQGGDRGALRRAQILRMSEEAYDQGALFTQEDLSRILGCRSGRFAGTSRVMLVDTLVLANPSESFRRRNGRPAFDLPGYVK